MIAIILLSHEKITSEAVLKSEQYIEESYSKLQTVNFHFYF